MFSCVLNATMALFWRQCILLAVIQPVDVILFYDVYKTRVKLYTAVLAAAIIQVWSKPLESWSQSSEVKGSIKVITFFILPWYRNK